MKLIEREGKKLIVSEEEIDLDENNKRIEIIQASIKNIDRNLTGLQKRRENLAEELEQRLVIKRSATDLEKPVDPDPAPVEQKSSLPE